MNATIKKKTSQIAGLSKSNKGRVLLIVTRLNIGGVAKHVVNLARGLGEIGYEVIVAAGRVGKDEGDMAYYARKHNVTVAPIPELGRTIRWSDDVKAFVKLHKLVKSFRPHVVHTHTAKAGTLGRMVARLHKTPLIVHTYHGHVFHGYFSPFKTKIILLIERALAKLTDQIVVLNGLQQRELHESYKLAPATKFSVISLDFDQEDFLKASKNATSLHDELGLSGHAQIVAAVGRIVPIKNPQLFLKIAQNITANHANVHFVFIGGGAAEDETRALAVKWRLAEKVHFLGWREEIAAMYNEIDVLLITSKNEGTPYTILEAMAAGCPVVAAKVGGIPGMIVHGKTGLLFESGDISAGATAVEEILCNPKLNDQISREAKAFIAAAFSVERLIKRLDQLYQHGV